MITFFLFHSIFREISGINWYILITIFILFHAHRCFVCICICAPLPSWYPGRPEVCVRVPRMWVRDGYEQPCGFWEPNKHPLEIQLMLLRLSQLSSPWLTDFNTMSSHSFLLLIKINSGFLSSNCFCSVPAAGQHTRASAFWASGRYVWLCFD